MSIFWRDLVVSEVERQLLVGLHDVVDDCMAVVLPVAAAVALVVL
jgi:hypothetical protein